MISIISDVSIAQAATIINATIAFVQYSLSLSLAILLIFFMPTVNSAIAWSSITRTLHSTLWPTIFRMDPNWNKGAGAKTETIIRLSTITIILVPIAGITLPLGLRTGSLLPSSYRYMEAKYIPDGSTLGLATTSNRHDFQYGRSCTAANTMTLGQMRVPCPGDGDVPHNATYTPSIVEIFNSTPHGPFSMQFRRSFSVGIAPLNLGSDPLSTLLNLSSGLPSASQNLSGSLLGTLQSFILRDDAFAVEGLIVDMSLEHPGVGLWNHTMPNLTDGGTWAQDVLWLEPVTECVNTNLTVEYTLTNGPDITADEYNITDRGGFLGLPYDPPLLNRDGQHLNLTQHAYMGAIYSNSYTMGYLNATRESSFNGKSYQVPEVGGGTIFWGGKSTTTDQIYINATRKAPYTANYSFNSYQPFLATIMASIPLGYPSASFTSDLTAVCQGFGGEDIANISNVHIACGGFLGVPLRIDGGDPRAFDRSSRWSQGMYVCASATRASIQRVTFSTNNTSQLENMQISRQPVNSPVLWAIEKLNATIQMIELLWGRVDERFEGDPSLWTFWGDHLYLPAGVSSVIDNPSSPPGQPLAVIDNPLPSGQPLATHEVAWDAVYGVGGNSVEGVLGSGPSTLMDYTGSSDYAVQVRLQLIIEKNPIVGPAQVRNIIWTDIMANNIIGTQSSTTLLVAPYRKSIEYDLRFAIPGLILLVIWAPAFLIAIGLLATRSLSFHHMRKVLQHTSIGRVVVGGSALRVQGLGSEGRHNIVGLNLASATGPQNAFPEALSIDARSSPKEISERRKWSVTVGATPIVLDDSEYTNLPASL